MNLPTAEQYLQTIDQRHKGGMTSLYNYHFLLEEDGKTYLHKKGNNAIVFKTESQSKLYAIRFFFYQEHELFRRYVQLQDYLNSKNRSWMVPFCFLDKEYYPFLKMDWVEGLSFSEYLATIIHDPAAISSLQSKLVNLSAALEEDGISHGDLNPDHIRFAKEGQEYVLKLIDYDSMFIPAFKGKDSLRIGTAGFQHPMRLASDFSETTDRFSFWVFLTALEAFKINPSLWIESGKNGAKNQNQLIFSFSDLAFPEQSSVFNELKRFNREALNFYVDKLTGFCNKRSAEAVDFPQLFGESAPTRIKKEQALQKTASDSSAFEKEMPSAASLINREGPIPIQPRVRPAVQNKNDSFQQASEPQHNKVVVPSEKGNKKRRMILIGVAGFLLMLISVYFIRPQKKPAEAASNPLPVIHHNSASPAQRAIPAQASVTKEASVFTPAAITNALTQLYQSYHEKNLDSILSSYADNLDAYYDATAVNRDVLAGIIKNLFIKPYSYQCDPDWQSMKIENQNNGLCKVTITLNEKIKTRKRSKQENYTSQIQYTFDKDYKVISEKRVG